ncbi:MAG TPA: hypothetical protein VMV04_22620 [Thermodesulfobacteriota bacterium]|nr:hypothetical protein [Thermodesulfobacteriota bacterium]
MNLNQTEVNDHLKSFLGRDGDSFQQAWVDVLESNPQTLEEITPIVRKIRNGAIKQYFHKKHREVSLYKPIGKSGDEKFTLESILASPTNETAEENDNGNNGLYKKIVDFLMGEYFSQRSENLQLKSKEIELKTERLRLRQAWLIFKRDRYESWKKLMEEKGRQKENRFKVRVQLQRERLELRRKQLHLKGRKQAKLGYTLR